jgi:hypothetical protein
MRASDVLTERFPCKNAFPASHARSGWFPAMQLPAFLDDCAPKEGRLVEVVVLGPYPSVRFFQSLHDWGKKRKWLVMEADTTLVADDGWDQEQIEQIAKLYDAGPAFRVHRAAADTAAGLVHAKLYYLKFQNGANGKMRRVLLLGSANASEQGFGTHAETYVHIPFPAFEDDAREAVSKYLRALQDGDGQVDALQVSLAGSSWVHLPLVRFVPSGTSYNSFDAWLRRGLLCHQYQKDPNFGCILIKLKRKLPRGTEEGVFDTAGLASAGGSQLRRYRYESWERADEDEEVAPRWRARFFIETIYGFWTSEDCFRDREDEFAATGRQSRTDALDRITALNETRCNARIRCFITTLQKVHRGLMKVGLMPGKYLSVTPDGKLDVHVYAELARVKIARDSIRGRDKGFARRFQKGYDFVRVPPLGEQLEYFAQSWAETVYSRKAGRGARLPQAVYAALWDGVNDDEELLRTLRADWVTMRDEVNAFHIAR